MQKFLLENCSRVNAPLIIGQQWFRWWLGAVKQPAIIYLCHCWPRSMPPYHQVKMTYIFGIQSCSFDTRLAHLEFNKDGVLRPGTTRSNATILMICYDMIMIWTSPALKPCTTLSNVNWCVCVCARAFGSYCEFFGWSTTIWWFIVRLTSHERQNASNGWEHDSLVNNLFGQTTKKSW